MIHHELYLWDMPWDIPWSSAEEIPWDIPWDIPWKIPWDIPWHVPWSSPWDQQPPSNNHWKHTTWDNKGVNAPWIYHGCGAHLCFFISPSFIPLPPLTKCKLRRVSVEVWPEIRPNFGSVNCRSLVAVWSKLGRSFEQTPVEVWCKCGRSLV